MVSKSRKQDRKRFEIRLSDSPRDERIARWLDNTIAYGYDAGELIKGMLDRHIEAVVEELDEKAKARARREAPDQEESGDC